MAVHFEDEQLRIHKVVASSFNNNAYVVVCRATGESVVIDAPEDADKVLAETRGTRVRAILITHRHPDHTAGFTRLKAATKAAGAIGPADAEALPGTPDFYLMDSDIVPVGHLALRVIHTPGHTPGAACLLIGRHLFSGDTLFPGGPGNTVSPAALRQSIASITAKLHVLPDDTAVYPGHGADTTIADSKREYAAYAGKPHSPDLCGDVLWLQG
ncbi:MAG: MBL fold metallo-hydrolase [Dehalococcoidia bacterium]|nr:MBL fold metallo-hydrolase [Dehalococcoidia bacterium]